MSRYPLLLGACMLAATCAGTAAAALYKWTDAQGRIVYSDQPPAANVKTEPTQKVEKIYVPVKTKKTEFLTGTAKEVAAKLVEKLRFEARVI